MPPRRPAEPTLMGILARSASLAEALPHLHEHALRTTGGRCALLFECHPTSGLLHATSAYGLDDLRLDPWVPSEREQSLVAAALLSQTATLVGDIEHQMPDLSGRLAAPSALLIPLARADERIGLLVVGFSAAPPPEAAGQGAREAADAFLTALVLFRLKQREERQRDLQDLLDECSAILSESMDEPGSLAHLCRGATQLFGADRTTAWRFERRARVLALAAASDRDHPSPGLTVAADDPDAPAARALRRGRAELVENPSHDSLATATLLVPLRGRRRALGALVCEGVRSDVGGELDLLERAAVLGRQFSSAFENVQLLNEVIRSRHDLERAFDAMTDLVVIADAEGRIVLANRAFAARVGMTPEDLADQPLSGCFGAEVAAWLQRALVDPWDEAATVRHVTDTRLAGQFTVTIASLSDETGIRGGLVVVAQERAAS